MVRFVVFLAMLAGVRQLSATPIDPIEWAVADGGNGHFYQILAPTGGIAWTDAKAASEDRAWMGAPGHLVTITSQEEWDFILANFPHSYTWIGLSDADWEGNFRWVTGEPFEFSAWATGPQEPNNAGNEDYVHYASRSTGWGWNDFKNRATVYGVPHRYIVEYPVAEPSALVLAGICAAGFLAFAVGRRKRRRCV